MSPFKFYNPPKVKSFINQYAVCNIIYYVCNILCESSDNEYMRNVRLYHGSTKYIDINNKEQYNPIRGSDIYVIYNDAENNISRVICIFEITLDGLFQSSENRFRHIGLEKSRYCIVEST